jgi:putative peptidoglycan lipid II flippase
MQHAGVALATAAGFWINFLALLVLLRKRIGRIGGRAILASLLRFVLASVAMGAVVWVASAKLVPYRMIWTLPLRVGWVGAAAALGTGAFLAFATLLRAPEVGEVFGALRKKRAGP